MNKLIVSSYPYSDQKPGTSGLRKRVKLFQQTHYLENFVQSVFNATMSVNGSFSDKTLVVGGDGRYYSNEAIQIIIKMADDFSYTDPLDGSLSQHQGIRILMQDGSRIIYRLSGTGTQGAPLRVYIESHESNPEKQSDDPQNALAELIVMAAQIAKIDQLTGRTKPDVVT